MVFYRRVRRVRSGIAVAVLPFLLGALGPGCDSPVDPTPAVVTSELIAQRWSMDSLRLDGTVVSNTPRRMLWLKPDHTFEALDSTTSSTLSGTWSLEDADHSLILERNDSPGSQYLSVIAIVSVSTLKLRSQGARSIQEEFYHKL